MSTFAEIESAVDRLALIEQEALLRHLQATVRRRKGGKNLETREQWMERLDALRASIGSGRNSSTEQILDELREERI